MLHFSLHASVALQAGDPVRDSSARVSQFLLAWLGLGIRAYLTSVHAGVLLGAESLRSMPSESPRALQINPANNRTTRRIDANTAWHVLERAAATNCAPSEYLQYNETDVSLRVSTGNAHTWEAIDCDLFMQNSSSAFRGCKQISLAFDPSTYSGEDTGVATAYNPTTDVSTVSIKIIPRSKLSCLGRVEVEPDVAAMIGDRKIERWSSYKEMRAISSIVNDLTGMPLDSFKSGNAFCLRALKQGEIRIVNLIGSL